MQMTQENDLIYCLKNIVLNYLNTNPKLTINSFAQRANVPATSLRRLLGGGHKSDIAPHSVLNLVSYIYREKNISKLINRIDQVIGKFLKKHFGQFVFTSEVYKNDQNILDKLTDQTKFLIFKMARHHQGLNKKNLLNHFGNHGLMKAKEMIQENLIKECNDILYAVDKEISLPVELVANHLSALIEYTPAEFKVDNMRHFSHISESLTRETIEEIAKIQDEAYEKIISIISKEHALGDIPFFCLNLSEMMNTENLA